MWVTSLPRRTDSVKAPGLDDDNRARNDPSKPRSSSSVSASTPDTDGWNHLREIISLVQESGGVPNQLLLVGSPRCSFSGVCCSSFHRTPCARFCDLWLEKRFTIRNFRTPSLTCLTGSLVVVWIRSLLNANQQPMVMMVAADRVCALIFDIFPTFLHSLFLSGDSFSSLFFRGFLYPFRRIPNHYTFHVWILDFPGYPPGGAVETH